jgi:hypothetical protein
MTQRPEAPAEARLSDGRNSPQWRPERGRPHGFDSVVQGQLLTRFTEKKKALGFPQDVPWLWDRQGQPLSDCTTFWVSFRAGLLLAFAGFVLFTV